VGAGYAMTGEQRPELAELEERLGITAWPRSWRSTP
jgi:hypothetical protein